MKILHIVGTRPHFIKLAPIIEVSKNNNDIKNIVVHTDQHYAYELSKIFFDEFGIPLPDYHLDVGSGTHGIQTGQMLERLDPVLIKEQPDVVLVYGDTNTTLAGALAAYKFHIPCGHIESGMREHIWRPEEINKKIADFCSDFLFCSTKTAVQNLLNEGINKEKIFLTGDITYDTFIQSAKIAKKRSTIHEKMNIPNKFILLTMHRAETVDIYKEVIGIVDAMLKIKEKIIYPIHPRTKKTLQQFGLYERIKNSDNIELIEPVGYFDFIELLLSAQLVITDSSGVLKEAFYGLKPCITLDYSTEYPEIFNVGYNILAGHSTDMILKSIDYMIDKKLLPLENNPLGSGNASEKILKILLEKKVKFTGLAKV